MASIENYYKLYEPIIILYMHNGLREKIITSLATHMASVNWKDRSKFINKN